MLLRSSLRASMARVLCRAASTTPTSGQDTNISPAPETSTPTKSTPGSSTKRRTDTTPLRMDADVIKLFDRSSQKYHLHCLTSHSNTLLTLTNSKHEPILWTSAGLCGFKKAARGGYEAGFRSMTTMLERMKQREDDDAALELKKQTEPQRVQRTQAKKQKPPFRPKEIELIIKDFGLGREAIMNVLTGIEGDHYRNRIKTLIDATPLKFGGVRARAVRRL